jgi:uncharacterized protein YaaQ
MLLLITIVQSEDAPDLPKQLIEQGLRLTQINSTGGLFGTGNAAFLLGIEEQRQGAVVNAIQANCRARMKYISFLDAPDPTFLAFSPMEVEVGGAVVFCVPAERFVRISGSLVSEEMDGVTQATAVSSSESQAGGQTEGASKQMKLIVAIVHADDANGVVATLLEAGHRLTRINTVGGFLRRGNATLLIGVEPEQVDEVLTLMQAACRHRSEPTPIEKGIPEYAATVFVLDASNFMRF